MSQHCTWRQASVGRDSATDHTLVTVYCIQPPSCPPPAAPWWPACWGEAARPSAPPRGQRGSVSTGSVSPGGGEGAECWPATWPLLRGQAAASQGDPFVPPGAGASFQCTTRGRGPASTLNCHRLHYVSITSNSIIQQKVSLPKQELFRGPFKPRNFFWLRPGWCLGWAGGEELCNLGQPIGGRGASLGPPPPIRSGVAGLETRAMHRRGIRISGCAPLRDMSHL